MARREVVAVGKSDFENVLWLATLIFEVCWSAGLPIIEGHVQDFSSLWQSTSKLFPGINEQSKGLPSGQFAAVVVRRIGSFLRVPVAGTIRGTIDLL
jgi:hypothetical protein